MATFPETLTTERLQLRLPTLDDAEAVFRYASDPEVARYMTFPLARQKADVVPFLQELPHARNEDRGCTWALERKDTPGLIGMIEAHRHHGLELGYVLAQNYWGQGYMPEAMRAVLMWGFETARFHRVWATCDVDNENSAKVMRKVGMSDEGILRRWEVHPNVSGEPRDSRVLAITRSEYADLNS